MREMLPQVRADVSKDGADGPCLGCDLLQGCARTSQAQQSRTRRRNPAHGTGAAAWGALPVGNPRFFSRAFTSGSRPRNLR